MALLWELDNAVWVDNFSKNHINVVVNGGSTDAWRFTGFYRELDTNFKDEAWGMLCMLRAKPHLPWCCMGDFNKILKTEEKRGGRIRPKCSNASFQGHTRFLWFFGSWLYGSGVHLVGTKTRVCDLGTSR